MVSESFKADNKKKKRESEKADQNEFQNNWF